MRRVCSVLLLLLMALPFAAATFAATRAVDDGLPACCRRNGKHHCAMSMAFATRQSGDKPVFRAPPERCPYVLLQWATVHRDAAVAGAHGAWLAVDERPDAFRVREAQACRRVSRERARHKRGPPVMA